MNLSLLYPLFLIEDEEHKVVENSSKIQGCSHCFILVTLMDMLFDLTQLKISKQIENAEKNLWLFINTKDAQVFLYYLISYTFNVINYFI